MSQSCFPIQNLLYFENKSQKFEKVTKFWPKSWKCEKTDFQVSSKLKLFSFKLAGTELPKSRFPRFKGWLNHVFLSYISYILRISHKNWKKSSSFCQYDGNVKNSDFQVRSKIVLFFLKSSSRFRFLNSKIESLKKGNFFFFFLPLMDNILIKGNIFFSFYS